MKTTLLSILSILCSVMAISQTTVTCPALLDNTLRSESPTRSSGASQWLYVGRTDNPSTRRALLKFDLSAIPAGATINSVTLTMRVNRTQSSAGLPVALHKVSAQWGEGTSGSGVDGGGQGATATANDATWTMRLYPGTPWATNGGDFVATASATSNVGANGSSPTWSSAQMATDVQNWLLTPATNFGWLLKATSETGSKNAKRFASREDGTVALRPTLSVTYTVAPLPVTFISLSATENKHGVLLNWKTQSEINNSFFLIEHSRNGVDFTAIGKVNGAGTSNSPQSYNFIHQLASGDNYYRLAQTDISGQVRYSNVVNVNVKSKNKTINITPNPVADFINLQGISIDDKFQYTITNVSGTTVLKGSLISNKINTTGLAAGIYILTISNSSDSFSGKFMKK